MSQAQNAQAAMAPYQQAAMAHSENAQAGMAQTWQAAQAAMTQNRQATMGQNVQGPMAQMPQGAENSNEDLEAEEKTLFLNIVVVRKPDDATIKKEVNAKVPNPFGFGVLQGIAGNVAAQMLTEDKVATNLATKMPTEIPG